MQKIRNVRAEMQIPLGAEIEIRVLRQKTDGTDPLDAKDVIETLTKSSLHFDEEFKGTEFGTKLIFNEAILFIPLPKDLLFKECIRIEKQMESLQKKIDGLKTRLENPEFVSKAPAVLLENTNQQYRDLFNEMVALKTQHDRLLIANSDQNR